MHIDEKAPSTPESDDDAVVEAEKEDDNSHVANTADEAVKSRQTVPQSNWSFAFGPQRRYWMRVDSAWRFVRYNTNDWNNIGIREPSWVAFKHVNGFLIGGLDEEGEPQVIHNWNSGHLVRADEVDEYVETRKAYEDLHQWLDVKQLKDTSVSIGPKGSYFARCGSSWISRGLPKDLMTKLERNKDEFTPMHVALGMHGSWIVLWSDGDVSWNLRNSYPTLAESHALNGAVGQVVFVALNPYEENGYFISGEDGCCMNANLDTVEECASVRKMAASYMQSVAKTKNTTFDFPIKINGMVENMHITPNSYERRAGDSFLEIWRQRRVLAQRDNMALIGGGAAISGIMARFSGSSPVKAAGTATMTGLGLACGLLYGVRDGLRTSQRQQE